MKNDELKVNVSESSSSFAYSQSECDSQIRDMDKTVDSLEEKLSNIIEVEFLDHFELNFSNKCAQHLEIKSKIQETQNLIRQQKDKQGELAISINSKTLQIGDIEKQIQTYSPLEEKIKKSQMNEKIDAAKKETAEAKDLLAQEQENVNLNINIAKLKEFVQSKNKSDGEMFKRIEIQLEKQNARIAQISRKIIIEEDRKDILDLPEEKIDDNSNQRQRADRKAALLVSISAMKKFIDNNKQLLRQ